MRLNEFRTIYGQKRSGNTATARPFAGDLQFLIRG